MVQASVFSSADASRLTALVQTEQNDSDDEMGAPAAQVYKGHSDGIIGTLEGLTEKAEGQLDKARKTETTAAQNYQMLKQSLTDEIKLPIRTWTKPRRILQRARRRRQPPQEIWRSLLKTSTKISTPRRLFIKIA